MMEIIHYNQLKIRIRSEFASEYSSIKKSLNNPCKTSMRFAREYIWVVINAGMKYQVAHKIYCGVIDGLNNGIPAKYTFNHLKKAEAIEFAYYNRSKMFSDFKKTNFDVDFLETLPWIGSVTKYHLARNLGVDVCKPDRHLVRISEHFNTNPKELCEELANKTGDQVGMIDFVLWGSGNLGII